MIAVRMKEFISVAFMLIAFNINLYARYDYSLKDDLTLMQIKFIQNLTEYSSGNMFSYANTRDGFNVSELTDDDKRRLLAMLRGVGIVVNRKAFMENGKIPDSLVPLIKKYYRQLDIYLTKANRESESLKNLKTADWLELLWQSGLNSVSLFTDLYGVGEYAKATKVGKYIQKNKILKKFEEYFHMSPSSKEEYKRVHKALEFFSSKKFIFISAFISSGFKITNEMAEEYNADKALSIGLKEYGLNTGKVIAGKLSKQVSDVLLSEFVGKFFEAVSILVTDSAVLIISGDEKAKFLSDLISELSKLAPIYGPLATQYEESKKIFDRTVTSPEAIQAWQKYLEESNKIREKINALNSEALAKKLDAILNYANQINLDDFPDVPYGSYAYEAIMTLKKLNIVNGKIIKYNTGIVQFEYRPNDLVSVGEFLTMVTLIEFQEVKNKKTFWEYSQFLVDKGINISISSTTPLTKKDLDKPATRGYVAKIITNIDRYKSSEHLQKCHYANKAIITDDGFLVSYVTEVCDNKSKNNASAYSQITTCKKIDRNDFDECSNYLYIKGITHRINKYEPRKNITRGEIALILYRLYKGVSNKTLTYAKLLKDVK